MNPKSRYLLSVFVLGLFIITGYSAFIINRRLNQAAMKSCIWSLADQLKDAADSDTSGLSVSPNVEWRLLGIEESKTLIGRLIEARKTDCGTIGNMQEGNDYWGNSINIAFRKPVDSQTLVKVWSIGPDQKENTDDDIIAEAP